MFKGFSDSSRNKEFHGFPNLNFQMNNEAYGFSGCTFWLDAAYGLNTQTDLAAVTYWEDRIQRIRFEQATAANQPRLILSDPNFNNFRSVEFNGTTRGMNSQKPIVGQTFAFCAKVNTIASGGYNHFLRDNGNDQNLQKIALGGGSTFITNGGTGIGVFRGTSAVVNVDIQSSVLDTNPHIIVISTNSLVIDGLLLATGNFTWTNGFTRIGDTLAGTTAGSFNGSTPEIVGYSSSFNEAQCVQLSNNINSKYAIY